MRWNQKILQDTVAACRRGMIAVALFSLCINLLLLTVPLYMLQLFDRVLTSRSTETLILLSILAFVAVTTLAALEVVRGAALVRIGAWLDRNFGGAVLLGSVISGLQCGGPRGVQGLHDLVTFRTFLTGPGIFPILDAPWTPLFIAVIWFMHPLLGGLALAGAVALFALAVCNDQATRRLLHRSAELSNLAFRHADAAVRNADVIEAMGMMPALVRRWQAENAEALALQDRASYRAGALTSASKFVRLSLQIGILGTGVWLALIGEITPGVMIAASIIMGRALAPVEQAISSWRSALSARAAYHRVKDGIQALPLRGRATSLPTPGGCLRVTGVTYLHRGTTKPVLRNVRFDLEPAESLGIVGPSGAGKTTLARLLVGNLRPQSGHVRLDAADIAQWDPEDLGRHIGYLPQDVELFGGTVRDNIARMAESTDDCVIAAGQLAGIHELVLHLPQGYETEIGEDGTALSGGERQRVALARALFGDPRFVVLDEPSASLDQRGEQALIDAISALKARGVTLVVIAHRAHLLRQMDKILVLRGGRVEAFGATEDVIHRLRPVTDAKPTTFTAARAEGTG